MRKNIISLCLSVVLILNSFPFLVMADTDRALMVDNEDTYKFIENMIKTCRECFSTDKIHIGMDEAHGLGRGKFLDI